MTMQGWLAVRDRINKTINLTDAVYIGSGVLFFRSNTTITSTIENIKMLLINEFSDQYDVTLTAMMNDGYNDITLNFEFKPLP